ncbi:hypothetical protein B0J12DRAFT_751381 [Macrophomina phaseolina]|uniref:Cupin type-2 domain-containing protein n=1 Tax=Macrophomina phaseolina TaxID=35725 RepID=A0ABQ8FQ31_9PEZI|nr:hypothetical protein B0J12DRAFT_751381 [Macrophomina phaseolina]
MGYETIKTLSLGKGFWLDLKVDPEAPVDAVYKYAMDFTCDGGEDSVLFENPPHWHEHHTEHITILEGSALVTVEGKTSRVHSGDPECVVPATQVHSIKSIRGEKMVLRESPEPAGLYKAQFFHDFFSSGTYPGFWHALRAFYNGDTYIALPGNIKLLDKAFILVFGGIAKLFITPKKHFK